MKQYTEICSILPSIDHPKISKLLTTDYKNDEIDVHFRKLQDRGYAPLSLQSGSTTLSDAQILFANMLKRHPTLIQRLERNSPRVENCNFGREKRSAKCRAMVNPTSSRASTNRLQYCKCSIVIIFVDVCSARLATEGAEWVHALV